MSGLFAIFLFLRPVIFLVFSVGVPARYGWEHVPIVGLVIYVLVCSLSLTIAEVMLVDRMGKPRDNFGVAIMGTVFLWALKLMIFAPVAAVSYFGAAAIRG